MKLLTMTIFSVSLILAAATYAQIKNTDMSSTIKTSPTIEKIQPLERGQPPAQSGPRTSSVTPRPPSVINPEPLFQQQAMYFHPGILVNRGGTWEGSDHLLNITPNIGVYVTILKPQEEKLDFTEEQILHELAGTFEKFGIKPINLVSEGKPPLPAFEVEILIYPIEKGYVACCEGRLFESVTLDRFKLDPNMAFQAITWEKQALIVGPKTSFVQQIQENVREIAESFGERFQAYERIKRSAFS